MKKLNLIGVMILIMSVGVYAEVTQSSPKVQVTTSGISSHALGTGTGNVANRIDAFLLANPGHSDATTLRTVQGIFNTASNSMTSGWIGGTVELTNPQARALANYVTSPPPLNAHRITTTLTFSVPVSNTVTNADGTRGTVPGTVSGAPGVDATGFNRLYTAQQAVYDNIISNFGSVNGVRLESEQIEGYRPENNLGTAVDQDPQTHTQLKDQGVVLSMGTSPGSAEGEICYT
ncbi:MAG: hypothetical protein AABW88_01310 [Nanoarchaeota archaeon]